MLNYSFTFWGKCLLNISQKAKDRQIYTGLKSHKINTLSSTLRETGVKWKEGGRNFESLIIIFVNFIMPAQFIIEIKIQFLHHFL